MTGWQLCQPRPADGVDTGKTLGGHWAELDAAGRRGLLSDIGVKALVCRMQVGAEVGPIIEWVNEEPVNYPRPWVKPA